MIFQYCNYFNGPVNEKKRRTGKTDVISVPVRRQIPTQFLYFCHTLLPETKSPSVPRPWTGKSVFYLHGIIYDAVNPVKGLCSIRTPDRAQQWDIVILIIMGQDPAIRSLSQGSGFPPRLPPSQPTMSGCHKSRALPQLTAVLKPQKSYSRSPHGQRNAALVSQKLVSGIVRGTTGLLKPLYYHGGSPAGQLQRIRTLNP